ncbi:MAG: ROK family protein, partial [Clostridia bacterium]|nr:ROK family protein [Clostridia bacterium]
MVRLGIDLGGTNIAVGVVNEQNEILATASVPTALPRPAESTAAAKMDSRTKDPKRDPGIFGDYWWANRFL